MEDILEEAFFLTEKNANYQRGPGQQLALKKQALSPVLEISDTAYHPHAGKEPRTFLSSYLAVGGMSKERNCPFMWKMWRYPLTQQIFYIKISLRQRWRSLSVWRQSESQACRNKMEMAL